MNYSDIISIIATGTIIVIYLFGGTYFVIKWRLTSLLKLNNKCSKDTHIEKANSNIDIREAVIEVRQQLKFLFNGIESMCEESSCIDSDTLMGFRLISLNIQRKLSSIEQILEKT